MLPLASNATAVGCDSAVLLICIVAARLDTRSACPTALSAEGPLAPAVNTATGNRSTRLFPVSVTQRLPAASKARPLRPTARLRVLALTPPVFAPDDAKEVCPMIMLGNWYPAGWLKGCG